MRARVAVALGLALALAAPAGAQPPSGVVHPEDEPGKPLKQLGAELYAGNCASCHGIDGRGAGPNAPIQGAGDIKGLGPSLQGVGAMAADFYLRTGFMPLANPHDQPYRREAQFSEREIRALVAFVASLRGGPAIPAPVPEQGKVAQGLQLFTEHCAGCHQVVGEGGFVTGARVPPIKEDTPVQIAEAVRIGPYLMPKFSKRAISDSELNSIIAYIQASKKPDDRGGWGIGHIGPVPEGLVTWLVAAVALVLVCALVGERMRA